MPTAGFSRRSELSARRRLDDIARRPCPSAGLAPAAVVFVLVKVAAAFVPFVLAKVVAVFVQSVLVKVAAACDQIGRVRRWRRCSSRSSW